jgi:type I restriction enzyme S subunit
MTQSAYKDSGAEWIGRLPTRWAIKPAFSVLDEVDAKNERGLVQNVLSLSYGRIVRRDVESNFGLLPQSFNTYQIVQTGDIVLRLLDLQNDHVSLRVGLVPEAGIVTSAYLSVRPKGGLDPHFASYLLHAYDLKKVFYSFGGGCRQSMGFEDLRRLPIPFPSPAEQQRIAAYLYEATEKLDRLVASRQRQMELLREQRAALIQQAVTRGLDPDAPLKDSGLTWLGEIPKHWVLTQIKRETVLISKGSTPSTIGAEFVESGIRFLKAENITGGSVSGVPNFFIDQSTHYALRRSHLQPNDLLVVIAGATTGKAGVLGAHLTPANANQAVCFVRFRRAQMSRFCNEWLSLSPVRDLMMQRAVQSAQPNLAMPDLGAIPVVKMPHTELDQVLTHIGNIKERFAKILSTYERQIELLTEYRAALIQECVTGQRPVPHLSEPH